MRCMVLWERGGGKEGLTRGKGVVVVVVVGPFAVFCSRVASSGRKHALLGPEECIMIRATLPVFLLL